MNCNLQQLIAPLMDFRTLVLVCNDIDKKPQR